MLALKQMVHKCHFLENVSKRTTLFFGFWFLLIVIDYFHCCCRVGWCFVIDCWETSLSSLLVMIHCSFHIIFLKLLVYSFYPKFIFAYGCSLQFYTPNFSVATPIAETSVQMKYISELVSDLPIVSTFWACDRNVRNTSHLFHSSLCIGSFGWRWTIYSSSVK